MPSRLLVAATLLSASAASAGTVVWTGAVNTDFWTTGNWDFSAATNTNAGNFLSANTINDNMAMTGATAITFGALRLADGATFTLTNTTLTSGSGFGIYGTVGGSASFVSLVNSSVSWQFLNDDLKAAVDGSSQLELKGTGAAMANQSAADTVTLAAGGKFSFQSGNANNYAGLIQNTSGTTFLTDYFAGSAPSAGTVGTGPKTAFTLTGDQTPFFNDGQSQFTITAVPEPTTYGLLGAGAIGAAAFLRRRKRR